MVLRYLILSVKISVVLLSPVEDSVEVALRGGELGPEVEVVPGGALAVLHEDLVLVRAALRPRHRHVRADGDVVDVVAVHDEPG